MTEQEIFTSVRVNLLDLMVKFGAPANLEIVRNDNLTQQGRVDAPTIYMARGITKPRGYPRDVSMVNRVTGRMTYENKQQLETTILFEALVDQRNVSDIRVGDLLSLAARLMQTSLFINRLKKDNLQILRINERLHTFHINDREQYEAAPMLSLIVCYTKTLGGESPVISAITNRIKGI